MAVMRILIVCFLAALACAGAARADLGVVTIAPGQNLGLPFLCDWGYDWDERCFRDDSERLPVGGVDDKVWRAGLQFPLDAVPPEASVVTAELSLWADGVCVAPQRRVRPCEPGAFTLDAHPIYTRRWPVERLITFGPRLASAEFEAAGQDWIYWDLTDLVAAWRAGELENDGVLLKLADQQEDHDSSGPALPSSRYPDPEVRPRLTVWYWD